MQIRTTVIWDRNADPDHARVGERSYVHCARTTVRPNTANSLQQLNQERYVPYLGYAGHAACIIMGLDETIECLSCEHRCPSVFCASDQHMVPMRTPVWAVE
jgi:hypothetical protein